MPRLEIRPFTDEFVQGSGDLLAARHRAHRAAEPLLPARYEDPAAAAAEVGALTRSEGASGTVAVRGSRVVGYLLGVRRSDERWGPNVWIEVAGHAVEERVTNLLSSRFWPRRGFRATFLRLYRHIP